MSAPARVGRTKGATAVHMVEMAAQEASKLGLMVLVENTGRLNPRRWRSERWKRAGHGQDDDEATGRCSHYLSCNEMHTRWQFRNGSRNRVSNQTYTMHATNLQ